MHRPGLKWARNTAASRQRLGAVDDALNNLDFHRGLQLDEQQSVDPQRVSHFLVLWQPRGRAFFVTDFQKSREVC